MGKLPVGPCKDTGHREVYCVKGEKLSETKLVFR